MRLYPEWFIGGPWHGRDKAKVCPHLQSSVRVAMVSPITFDLRDSAEENLANAHVNEYIYVPKRADVFGEPVIVWVGEQDAGNAFAPNGDVADWVAMFGQLIMSPHRKNGNTEPFSVERYAEVHRQRFDIEREVTQRVERAHRDEITRLKQRIAFLAQTMPAQRMHTDEVFDRPFHRRGPEGLIENSETDAGEIKIKWDGRVLTARFDDITTYEDPGDDDNPPGFVSTAQAMGKTEDGDMDMVGFTGYGPDPVSAVLALLADKLGYYARLTDYGSKGRMR